MVPCRFIKGWGKDWSNEIRIWFRALPNILNVEMCGDNDVFHNQDEHNEVVKVDTLQKVLGGVIHLWRRNNARMQYSDVY